MQGHKAYSEKLFTSFQLSSRVPATNFYRRLKEELDLNFIRKQTQVYYGREGQSSIDPVVFFKLILVGYLENLNSDRKIIDHCSMRLDILYFLGYDIDEELPWHSTISRTRQLYGEEVFRSLFKKVLGLCVSKGMVSGKRQAIDSAYIKANASMDSVAEKALSNEVLADAEIYADELQDDERRDKQQLTVSEQKKQEVEQHHDWKIKEYKTQHKLSTNKDGEVDEFGNLIRPKYLSNHTHYSTTDPDARISVKPGKPRQFNYSAQTVVDTSSHVITNIVADYSDKRDSQSLPLAISQAKQQLSENGLTIHEVLADAAYSSGESLKYLEENNLIGYIPNFGQYKPIREGFTFNETQNQYECEQGNKAILPYRKTVTDSRGYTKKIYRSDNSKCKTCPLRTACIGKSDFKKIEESIDKPYYDRMHERLQTDKAKRLKKLRSSTVEPVLGTLINFMGMRRIWTRGIAGAGKFMLGAAAAYNLKKWMNYQAKKVKTGAMKKLREELSALKTHLTQQFFMSYKPSSFSTVKM